MKIERTKNATRNIIFGVGLKIYQILVPFLMRTAMIYFMGVQYLGLNSLFTSILQVLNLAELGVGSAMVFSMYKPIVEDDTKRICALTKLYKIYYNIIGGVIAIIGIALTPFVPSLISGDVPAGINVYVLYLLNLFTTVLSYWLFAYKNSLLQAHQRIDITSKISLILTTIQYALQLLVLWLFHNYYLYVIVALLTQAITNIVTAIVVTKMYPDYKPEGQLDKQEVKSINRRIKDLFTSKLGSVVVNSADTLVISAFLGLTVLAIYQNYYFIVTSVIGIITIVFNSCTAGIGNSLIVESEEKNFNDLKKFTFLIAWIAGVCSCFFLNLFQPFMELWVGENLKLEFGAVICFCIYYYIYEINQLLNTYKDAAGIWHQDRYRPLVTAIVNLGLNLITVQFWGIYGVILSTVISMAFVGMPWLFYNLFTTIFNYKYCCKYLLQIIVYMGSAFFVCAVSGLVCSFVDGSNLLIVLIVRVIISFLLPNILFWIFFHKLPEFRQSILLIDKMTKGKLNLYKFCKGDEL